MSLKHHWYIFAPAKTIKRHPVRRTIHGQALVAFRRADGSAAVLEDRCAHRNTALSTGRVIDDCLECPYHGWRYDAAGACRHVPSLGEEGHLPRLTVPAFPVREQDGYLWVFTGPESAVAESGEPYRFPGLEKAGWTSFRMQTRFAASVDACLENFLDCPHTVFVHRGWFRSHDTRALTAKIRRDGRTATAVFENEPISKSVVSRLLFPKARDLRHTDTFMLPNLSRVDYDFGPDRHFIIVSQCTPISDQATEVHTVITYRAGRIGPLVRLLFEPLSRKIIQQDVDILRDHAAQLATFGGPKYANVETDLLGAHIRAIRARREAGQSLDTAPADERTVTIRF